MTSAVADIGQHSGVETLSNLDIRVERLHLADVKFPDWHPRFAEGGCPVFGYAVRHPDGIILFDSVGFALADFSMMRMLHERGIGSDIEMLPELENPKDLISLFKS